MPRQKPWKTLRCVVEVKVPDDNTYKESDLIYHVQSALSVGGSSVEIPLPRSFHSQAVWVKPRVKQFTRVVSHYINRYPYD